MRPLMRMRFATLTSAYYICAIMAAKSQVAMLVRILILPIILCRPARKGPSQSSLGPFFFPIPSKPHLKVIFVLRNTLYFFPKYMVLPIFFGNILSKYGLWGAKFYGLKSKVHSLFSHRSDYWVFRYSLSWRLCV